MARPRRQSALLPGYDIEHLRRVLIYAREGLSLTRGDIAKAADVSAFDLDNFTALDPRSTSKPKKYKSYNPRLEFQRRALYFVLNSPEIATAATTRGSPIKKSFQALNKYRSKVTEPRDEDILFHHLTDIRAINSLRDCIRISDKLAGNYYLYRTLSKTNKVARAHLEIRKFDVYNKVPKFVHRRKDDDDKRVIFSKGTILDLNNRYIFHGLVFESRGH